MAPQPLVGLGSSFVEVLRSRSNTPHSVGLLWMSDQPVAETSTWQQTIFITDIHPCPDGIRIRIYIYKHTYIHTGCPRRNGQNLGRVFVMLKYTDIAQNTYVQSWTVTEIKAREKCGHLAFSRTVRLQLCSALTLTEQCSTHLWRHKLRPTR